MSRAGRRKLDRHALKSSGGGKGDSRIVMVNSVLSGSGVMKPSVA